MALVSSGTISIGGTTTNRSINLELGRSATATSSLNETDLRNLAGVSSGTISLSNFYGKSADNFIGFVSNFNDTASEVQLRINPPYYDGNHGDPNLILIGVAQDTRATGSSNDISLSATPYGGPTLIQPNNLAQQSPGFYERSQGFHKIAAATWFETSNYFYVQYTGNRNTIAAAAFSNIGSPYVAENVSGTRSSTGTVSLTRTTATNRTFIGLAASHAGSDNESSVNFSGYEASRKVGGSEELRGGCGVAYRQGTGVSQTYTHAYGGTDVKPSEYAFHELIKAS